MDKTKTGKKLSRREFLKVGAAGVGVAALGSLARQEGVRPGAGGPQGDQARHPQGHLFRGGGPGSLPEAGPGMGQAAGVTVVTDFLSWANVQPKISAAIHAGGVDVAELWPAANYLYKDNLVDITEDAEEVGRRGGGFEEYVLKSGNVGGRWYGIPHGSTNIAMNYRIGWFKEAGVANAEDGAKLDLTWDEFHALAKKCKEKGRPFGQALGHSTGDPPSFCYPYMWSYGAARPTRTAR